MAEMQYKKNALRTAFNVVVALVVMFLAACAKEELHTMAEVGTLPQDTTKVIIDHFANSQRSLFVNVTPKDSLCHSEGKFDMYSTLSFSNEDGTLYDMRLTPTASVRIDLTPAKQEVKSEVEIPTTKVSSKTISQSKTNNGLLFVFKKHQQDTYADGSQADIYLEWTARGYLNADGDTLMTGHVEFGEIKLDSLSYARHGEKTEFYDPFYVTHHYSIPYMEKGVTGQQRSFVLPLKPYREKAITDDPQVKTGEPTYDIKWVGCPVTKLNLVQTTPTNKGNVVVKESFDVVFNVTVPDARETASLDSLFSKISKGEPKYDVIGDTVMHANGFQSLNYAGSYTSRNKGLENGSNVETTATITASMPVKFANKWGSVDIKPLEPSFEEGGFVVTSLSQDEDFHIFKTVNTIIPKLGDCVLDAMDEIVNIKVGKDKPAIPVDSVYTKGGKGDEYDVLKTVIYSDASKREYPFSYTGWHNASSVNFGEKTVSNLSWSASELMNNGTSNTPDKKEFTKKTYFEVTYVTTNKVSNASNGIESGAFGFSETHPIVVFVDGDTRIEFDERKVVISGQKPSPATNYTIEVRNGVSYKGYAYNMTANVVYDGKEEADVTSQGLLLMIADEVGDPVYTYEFEWVGNTLYLVTTKTTPHTFGENEVEIYRTQFTVSMTGLQDGRVDAKDTNFSVTANPSEKALDPQVDGFYTISPRQRDYTYNVSNGSVSRQMSNTVIDATIAFNDGKGSHSWDAQLNVSKDDKFGTAYADGDFTVTPLTTTVTAIASGTGAPTLTESGVTSIYVENPKEISWRFTYVIDEILNGTLYADMKAEKLVNGKVVKTWKCNELAGKWGEYKPNVAAIYVTNDKFRDNYSTTPYTTDPGKSGFGDEGAFSYENTSKIEHHLSVLFDSNMDADGNTEREVAGHVNMWSYRWTFEDPETKHREVLDFVIEPKTTTHHVQDSVYTRVVEITCNGETVETQTGTVNVVVE